MNKTPLTTDLEDLLFLIKQYRKDYPICSKDIINSGHIDINPLNSSIIRQMVNELRNHGYFICADANGYYWPKTFQELNEYLNKFSNRICAQQDALQSMIEGRDRALRLKEAKDAQEVAKNAKQVETKKLF